MSSFRISVAGHVPAPSDRVYALLADYRVGHPSILPRPPFGDLMVEEGGNGEGTVIRFGMTILGATRFMRARVTEPAPGRVLMETGTGEEIVTTFEVEPHAGGRETLLTIGTTFPAKPGLRGAVERYLVRRLFLDIYQREIALVAAHFRDRR